MKKTACNLQAAFPFPIFWRIRADLFLLLSDGDQLHFKNQGFSRTNVGTRAAVAVRHVGGDKQLPFRSDGHQLQRFRPPLNYSAYRERNGLTGFVGTVEFLAIDERSAI